MLNFCFGDVREDGQIYMSKWVSGAFGRLEKWHYRMIVARWPYRTAMTKPLVLTIILLSTLAILMNMQVRTSQYEVWRTHNTTSNEFAFSTTDAPYFLGLAGAIKRGEKVAVRESLLAYPYNMLMATDLSERGPRQSAPLLSFLLAYIASSDDPADLMRAGERLVVICSGLTVALIIFAFGSIGFWLEGTVAAAGAGLSAANLVRTSAGRIDTDMLNMGLLYITFGAVLLVSRARSTQSILLCCVAAGIMARLFLAWYDRPQLLWLALTALVWLLIIKRKHALPSTCGIFIFISISGIDFFNPFLSGYLTTEIDIAAFIFPNTLSTITETSKLTWGEAMTHATSSVYIALVSLTGLALWAIRHPVLAISMSPLLALGLLNFIIGNRFIFYATPMLWFGLGYLLILTAKFIQCKMMRGQVKTCPGPIAPVAGALVSLAIVWGNTPTKYIPRVSFPELTLAGFASLDGQFDPAKTVVASWWDYGYASNYLNQLPVLNYGGAVNTPATHILARALLDKDQHNSLGMLKFLSTEGIQGVDAQPGIAALNQAFNNAHNIVAPDVLLIVTNQMADWMVSISKLGNWDIENGEPIHLRGNPDGAQVYYRPMNCRLNGYPQKLTCERGKIDLEQGLINGAPLLMGWAHTLNGKILRRRDFDHDADHAIQFVQKENRITTYLIHRQLYESTFNELFHLGLADHPLISLHYDDYPHIRIYRIDGRPND